MPFHRLAKIMILVVLAAGGTVWIATKISGNHLIGGTVFSLVIPLVLVGTLLLREK